MGQRVSRVVQPNEITDEQRKENLASLAIKVQMLNAESYPFVIMSMRRI